MKTKENVDISKLPNGITTDAGIDVIKLELLAAILEELKKLNAK